MSYSSIHPALNWENLTTLVKKGEQKLSMAGLKFLPEVEVLGQQAKWGEAISDNKLAPIVSVRSNLRIQRKESVILKTQTMCLIRQGDTVDLEDIKNLQLGGISEEIAIKHLGNQVLRLMGKVARTSEYLRWSALQGAINYTGGGVKINVDFGIPAGNKKNASVMWTQSNANPIKDIQDMIGIAADKGVRLTDIVMNWKVAQLLANNTVVENLLKYQEGKMLIAIPTAVELVAKQFFLNYTQVDDIWEDESGTSYSMLPDNKVFFYCVKDSTGTDVLGETQVGQCHLQDDFNLAPPGLFAQTKTYTDPLSANVTVSEVKKMMFPIIYHADWIFVLTVK